MVLGRGILPVTVNSLGTSARSWLLRNACPAYSFLDVVLLRQPSRGPAPAGPRRFAASSHRAKLPTMDQAPAKNWSASFEHHFIVGAQGRETRGGGE